MAEHGGSGATKNADRNTSFFENGRRVGVIAREIGTVGSVTVYGTDRGRVVLEDRDGHVRSFTIAEAFTLAIYVSSATWGALRGGQ